MAGDTHLSMEDLRESDQQRSDIKDCSLHQAIKNKKKQTLIYLIQTWESSAWLTLEQCVLAENRDGDIPLHFACKYDNSGEMVETLLNIDELIRKQLETENGIYGNTPLHVAACAGNVAAVSKILKHVKGLHASEAYCREHKLKDTTVLDDHLESKCPSYISELLSKRNKLKDTPVHGAASGGHLRVLEVMYNADNACIRHKGRYERRSIHTACGYGQIEVAKKLLEWDKTLLEVKAPIPASLPALSYTTELANKELTQDEKENLKEKIDELKRIEEDFKADTKVTPLTQACQFGYPEIVKFLLEQGAKPNPFALIRAIAGLYTECVYELLFTYNVKKRRIRFRSGYNYKKLLHFSYPLHNDPHTLTTPFRELIKHMPEVAEHVLQNCVTCDRFLITSENFIIKLNYEFVDDIDQNSNYNDDSEQTNNESSIASTDENDMTETRHFSKKAHPLSLMVEYKRKRLLTHPVVAGLFYDKWRLYGLWSLLYWALYSFVFLLFLNVLIFMLPNPNSDYCNSELEIGSGSCLLLQNTSDSTNCTVSWDLESPSLGLTSLIFIYSIVRIFLEVFQLIYACNCFCVCIKDLRLDLGAIKRIDYIKDPANWIEVPLLVLSVIFTVILFRKNFCLSALEWQIGVVVLFLAWIEFIFLSTQFQLIGLYAIMFFRVLWTLIKFIPLAFLLIVTFGLTFHFLLYKPELMGSPYFSPGYSFLKVLSMTTGDVNTDNFFGLNIDGQLQSANHLPYIHLTTIIWLLSLILMTIILSNLLIGLAVGDIQSIYDEAEFEKLKLQVKFMLNAESLFPKWHCCGQEKDSVEFSFEPNKTPNLKTQITKEFIYRVWGGIRFDCQKSIEKIISNDDVQKLNSGKSN